MKTVVIVRPTRPPKKAEHVGRRAAAFSKAPKGNGKGATGSKTPTAY